MLTYSSRVFLIRRAMKHNIPLLAFGVVIFDSIILFEVLK